MENNKKRRKLNNSDFTINLDNKKIKLEEINNSEEENNNSEENNTSEENNNTSEDKNTSEEDKNTSEENNNSNTEFIISEDSHEDIDSLDYKYGNFVKYQDVSDYTANYGENEDGDYENW